MEFNFAMSFDDIIAEYNLQTSYTEDKEYFFAGIYYQSNRIDENSVEEFLESLEYFNGQEVYLSVKYLP